MDVNDVKTVYKYRKNGYSNVEISKLTGLDAAYISSIFNDKGAMKVLENDEDFIYLKKMYVEYKNGNLTIDEVSQKTKMLVTSVKSFFRLIERKERSAEISKEKCRRISYKIVFNALKYGKTIEEIKNEAKDLNRFIPEEEEIKALQAYDEWKKAQKERETEEYER